MKKQILIIISIISIFLTSCGIRNSYQNSNKEFSINFPEGWQIIEEAIDSPIVVTAIKNDDSGTNINIAYLNLNAVTPLKTLVDNNISHLRKNTIDFKMLESKYLYIHKLQGYKIIYSHTSAENTALKVLLYCITSGSRFYVVTCTAPIDTFDKNVETFNQTIKSLYIKI